MVQENRRSSSSAHSDIRTDYALIAIATGAALFALVYLILI
jgi:hypothetical protein